MRTQAACPRSGGSWRLVLPPCPAERLQARDRLTVRGVLRSSGDVNKEAFKLSRIQARQRLPHGCAQIGGRCLHSSTRTICRRSSPFDSGLIQGHAQGAAIPLGVEE
jgi:hypothetical protein